MRKTASQKRLAQKRPLRVLMVAAEATPYAKSGGLADVLGSLPMALRHLNLDVRGLMPRYAGIEMPRDATKIGIAPFFDGQRRRAGFWEAKGDVPFYFLDAPRYFARDSLYGYDDDILRFGFLSRAALELPRAARWTPDIFHCHDWHVGLLPLYAKLRNLSTQIVFTIHNLAYQGLAEKGFLPRLGLPWEVFNWQEIEFHDAINPMKAGLIYSDEVTTVSPNYAREINTPAFGEGLHGVLLNRAKPVEGILNGLDDELWNPNRDAYLPANFSADDLRGKDFCKAALRRECGFEDNAPILAVVSRLTQQKGLDLVVKALPKIIGMGFRFVLLGSGEAALMKRFRALGTEYSGKVSVHLEGFHEDLAHRIYAGADFFLMPSRFEPCGLGQLIALRYGTIPVARRTGGIADTVSDVTQNPESGNGFLFEEFRESALLDALHRALRTHGSAGWNDLRRRAMSADFSWRVSAARYVALYQNLVSRPR